MFPVRSDLGNAQVDTSGNDMNEVIQAGKDLALFNRDVLMPSGNRPYNQSGIQDVGNMGRSAPLQFGGANYLPDPYGKPDTSLYDSYKQPQVTPEVGMSNDNKLFMQRQADESIDAVLKRRLTESQIKENERQTLLANRPRMATITDPDDYTKQINVNYNPDGTITPITLPGGRTNPQSGAQGKINADKAAKNEQEAKADAMFSAYAKQGLAELDQISKATGQFDVQGDSIEEMTPNLRNITGFSGNRPTFLADLNPNNATARASVDRLMKMLTLNRMQELKDASKTGTTGFGSNMNIAEFNTLVGAASKLATMNQSEPGYAKELGRIRVLLSKVANPTINSTSFRPVASHNSNGSTNSIQSTMTPPPSPKLGWEYVRKQDNSGWTAVKSEKK